MKISYYLALFLVFFLCQSQISKSKRSSNESLEIKSTSEARSVTDQVIIDDLIVDGSACVGQDCVNGESFGFDTQRYKENNLRIHFDDTSISASFPSNDWRITINDSGNGGASHFSIDDATSGRTPFRIEAGAPQHALYVESDGDIGLGTNNPVLELHLADGDSPSIRLEQNGTSGFNPQTWDIAGNEANFFIRDVTGGSKLPFKILPGSATNSMRIGPNGVSIINAILPGATDPSDARLKENLVSITDATSVINKLNAVSYFFKKELISVHNYNDKKQFGFVAQEVERILPSLVRNVDLFEDGNVYKTLSYDGIIPFLVKGFQEQQSLIEQQSTEIDRLKNQIEKYAKLEARLDALEGKASKVTNTKR